MHRRLHQFMRAAGLVVLVGLLGVLVTKAAIATVTVDIPGQIFIGDTFSVDITFDNVDTTEGYGPFIDVYFPVNGADGSANTSFPLDGVDYVSGSATYLGITVTETVLTFPNTPLGLAPCGASQSQVLHPYAEDVSQSPVPICGTPGDKLVVFQLPFGSFTGDQTPVTISFDATVSDHADLNTPLTLYARGGFQFGEDPLDNPCCDPSNFADPSPSTITDNPAASISPTLIEFNKAYVGPEGETATGPNFPRSYTLTTTVAQGQTVTNLDVFDYIDDNIVITGVTAPGASAITLGGTPLAVPVGPVQSDGLANELIINYASVSGVVTATIDFYVPYSDAGGTPVISPVTGADSVTENRAYVLGDWTPIDPRDAGATDNALAGEGTCPSCPPTVTHQNEANPVQKSVANLTDGTNSPGDVLEYTHAIQFSDYTALADLVIVDVISDGQRISGNPTINFTQHGAGFSNPVNAPNLQIREYFTGGNPGSGDLPDPDAAGAVAGDTVLVIDLSQEIFDELGLNAVLGGCVPNGGTGGPAPDCGVFNGGPTTVTISYQTTIQDTFSDQAPSGDFSVDHGDELTNTVDLLADTVLDPSNLVPSGGTSAVIDGSSVTLVIGQGALGKSIFAITDGATGVITPNPTGTPEIKPGDTITFRLQYNMPSTDFEAFSINDFLPLPVLEASEVTVFNDVIYSGTLPSAGEAIWGPATPSFASRRAAMGQPLENGGPTPTVITPGGAIPAFCGGGSIPANENNVIFCFGDFDDPGNQDTIIDILFTVTVSDDPFADDLFLTNYAVAGTGSTNAGSASSQQIIGFRLQQPVLQIKKGVLDSDSPTETFTNGSAGTTGVTFEPAGSAVTPAFSGSIQSADGGGSGNVDAGLDANVGGLDSGDTVRYVVTIQNTGGSAAYDITLNDSIPAGLVCNPATVNLSVAQGDGTLLAYNNVGLADPCDFFTNYDGDTTDGIIVGDPAAGACQSPTVSPAAAVIVITYDLEIDNTVGAGDVLLNTVTLTNYAGSEGGPNHVPDPAEQPTDDAELTIAGTFGKTIDTTSEPDTSDAEDGADVANARPVLIGEVVTYALTFDVPEGTTRSVSIVDTLPAGMQYVTGSASVATTNVDTGWSETVTVSGGATPGAAVTFNFGDIVNTDDDANVESLTLTFDAVVSNIPSNQDGTDLVNTAVLRADIADNPDAGVIDLLTSEERWVTVVEPNLEVAKIQREGPCFSATPITSGDAGDEYCYEVRITNTGSAVAHDISLVDIIPIDFLTQTGCCSFVGANLLPGSLMYNAATGQLTAGWSNIMPGNDVAIRFEVTIRDETAPGESWDNTADITYTSLPGAQGTGSATPGGSGAQNGERNGADGSGGALNDYAASATSPLITVPELEVAKQIEHPSQVPVADFFGGAYGDSTTDPNTGVAEYDPDFVDLTIGEEFSYIITLTFPEGTTYDLTMIDILSPLGHNNGRQLRVIEMLDAEVIFVGNNLSGSFINSAGVGTSFSIVDSNGDGDGTRSQLFLGDPRDVLNTPDGVVDDDDRYIIRITARIDDEDESGGPADDLVGISNNDGNFSGNRLQYQWRDQNGNQTTRNLVVENDIVEPNVSVIKITNTGGPVDAGDPLRFTLTLTNTGTAPAYNVTVQDDYPLDALNAPYLSFDAVDTAASTCDDLAGFAVDSTDPAFTVFSFDTLLPGPGCTIIFDATARDNITPGETYTNTAQVTSYDSRAVATDPDNRNYSGNTESSTFITAEPVITKAYLGTSEDHTDPGDTRAGTGNASEVPLVVGEIIRYQLNVTVIEGQNEAIIVSDTLPAGLRMIRDSAVTVTLPASVTSSNGGLVSGATTAIYNDDGTVAVAGVDTNTATDLVFELGDLVNSDTNNAVDEVVTIEFNALVLNAAAAGNDWGDQRDNVATVSEDGAVVDTSNTVHARIQEPGITVTKTGSPTNGDAGDTITFTLVIANPAVTNGTTAFDIVVADTLPAGYTNISLTSITSAGAVSGVTDTSAGSTIGITVDSIAQDASVTVVYTADLVTSVIPDQTVTNTASATYTSLPGPFGTDDGSGGNNTGSSLSDLNTDQGGHTSGADDGERNGSGSGGNDYTATDSADVTVDNVVPEKTLFSTSETFTADTADGSAGNERPVAIGEVVTFELAVAIPEGVSADVIKTDVLVPGLDFIDGTVTVYTNSVSSMTFADIGGVIPTTGPGLAVPADVGGAPTAPGTYRYDAGTRTVEINLGDITNNDSDVDAEQVIVRFDVVVVNDAVNSLGEIWTNEFNVAVGGNTPVTSNPVTVIVQEPQATVTKTINAALSNPAGTGPFDAGDTVVYDIVVSNPAGANVTDAFDLVITDGLDANLDLINPISFVGVPGGVTATDTSDYTAPGQSVNVTVDQLAPGQSFTIRVQTTVRDTVTEAQVIANQSDITWTSLPGPQGSSTPGGSGDTDGERNGSSTGANDYTDSSSDNFTVSSPISAEKRIIATSEAHTDDSSLPNTGATDVPVAVGEIVRYRLATGLAEGTMVDLALTDQLAFGVVPLLDETFTLSTVNVDPGTFSVPSYPALDSADSGTISLYDAGGTAQFAGLVSYNPGTNFLRLDFGDVINGDDDTNTEFLIVEFNVLVTNTVVTNLGDIYANDYEVFTDDFGGGAVLRDTSNPVTVIVQEPQATVTKTINAALSNPAGTGPFDAGDTVVYDIAITNAAAPVNTSAFDIRVADALDPNLRLDLVEFAALPGYASIIADNSTLGNGGSVDVTINRLDPGNIVVVRVTTTVLNTVTNDLVIGNEADVSWSSLPGTNGTDPNPTGSETPGAPGSDLGERDNSTFTDDGDPNNNGLNDYQTDDTEVFTVGSVLDTVKAIAGTSEPATDDTTADTNADPRPVVVGEAITYRLVTTVGELTSPDVLLTDVLVANVAYVTGSARVSYVANADGNVTIANAPGALNELTPSVTLDAAFVNFDGGTRELTFSLGQVVNDENDANAELVIVEFDVIVLDEAVNTLGALWANTFSVDVDSDGTDDSTSDPVYATLAEPVATFTKTFIPDEQVPGGPVSMTLVVSNLAADGATAPLYDVVVTDILDDWLDVGSTANISVSFNAAAAGSTFDLSGSSITSGFATGVTDDVVVAIDVLPVDGVATITVTMQVDPNADPLSLPRTITNTGDLSGDSLPADDDPDERDYTASATDDLNVVTPSLLVTKNPSLPVTSGSLTTYTIIIENTGTPNFDATNVVFTDELPSAADFAVTNVVPSQGGCAPIVEATRTLTCNLGTIASGATATLSITGTVGSPAGGNLVNTAYVTSDEGIDGNDGNDTDTDGDDARAVDTTPVTQAFDIDITKVVDDLTPDEGDLIAFTIDVTNNGPSAATNVTVDDIIPAGLVFSRFVPTTLPCAYDGGTTILSCTFPTIGTGTTQTIGIETTVDSGQSGNTIVNTATFTGTDSDSTNDSDDAVIFVDQVDVSVVKTVDNPTPNDGDTVIYSVQVTNNGPAPATGIEITDNLNGVMGITYVSDTSATLLDDAGNPTSYVSATGIWSIGLLGPNSSLTLQITATVDPGAGALTQPIVNTATRTATDQPDTDSTNDSDGAAIAVSGLDLALVKAVSDPTPDEGQTIVYTLQLTHNGGTPATNITVLDQLDSLPVTYVSSAITGSGAAASSYDSATGAWTIPALNAGQTIALQITVTVDAGTAGTGAIINTASITAVDQTDSDPANDTDDAQIVVNTSDVGVTKTVDNSTPSEGDTIVYSVTAVNNGPSVATGISISDNLPAGLTYVSDNAVSLSDSAGNPTAYDSATGVWSIGQLNSGVSLTLQITVTVDSGTSGTAITNTATVDNVNEDDDNAANDSDDASVSVGGLDLALTKSVDNPVPSEGDTIVYAVTVTNNGPGSATNIVITDNLPAGLSYVADDSASLLDGAGNPTTYDAGTGRWSIGQLNSSDALTLQITAAVDAGTAGSALVNTVAITALDQNDSDSSNNSDDATITVGAVDLAVQKVVDNSGPATGDTVTYTITVTNNGPAVATGISIDESLPLDNVVLTYISDTSSQGAFTVNNPGPSIWDVGTLAPSASATLQLTVTV
ncbi:MAG: isopeptide-forming domain-containing fimbrial protein, partial [Chloroflexota bacterium]